MVSSRDQEVSEDIFVVFLLRLERSGLSSRAGSVSITPSLASHVREHIYLFNLIS